MEKRKNYSNRKKLLILLLFVAGVIVFLILILEGMSVISNILKPDKYDYTTKNDDIFYFPADYSANPQHDIVYSSKEQGVFFIDITGFGELLTHSVEDSNNVKGLMYNYFEAIKNGDSDMHKSLLSSHYKSNFVVQEKFTKQKVYDINVSFLSSEIKGNIYVEKYTVTYKIYKNDGTYRADVGSDISKVLVFEVVQERNAFLINSIVVNYS